MQKLGLTLLSVLFFSCSEDDPAPAKPTPIDAEKEKAIAYFKEIALGFEFGTATQITRKWTQPMKIFVGGNPDVTLVNELAEIVDELNELSTDAFAISITSDTAQSNAYLYFGTANGFVSVYPPASAHVASNWGLFYVFWNANNDLVKSIVFVDTERTRNDSERKHLLREELTQSLGLARDSELYPESIFQSAWTTTTSYAEIDRQVIQLLYHPAIYSGLNATAVDPLLREAWDETQAATN